MSIFEGFFGNDNNSKQETTDNNTKLRLRKEELDISKNLVQKGEVQLSKEIVEEPTSVDVPITREEVVIERRTLNNEISDSPITNEETITIPVNEEIVNVGKHTIVTEGISAHKNIIEDTEHVTETLKREEAHINKIGNPDVVDNNIDQY